MSPTDNPQAGLTRSGPVGEGASTYESRGGDIEADADLGASGRSGFWTEFRNRDYSIYAQWIGLLSGLVCFSTGWQNVFSRAIIWSILAILFGFLIAILEVHWLVRLLFRCCPNKGFDDFRERSAHVFQRNEPRMVAYLVFSAVQFASISTAGITSLIANGILLLAAGLCYAWPAIKRLPFHQSPALGSTRGLTSFIL